MRSLLSYLSPYVRSLELQVEKLDAERVQLQNRLLHAYSGYELRQPVPSYADAQGIGQPAVNKAPSTEDVIGRGIMSTESLMQEYEKACLAESEGITGVTIEAERQRVIAANAEAGAEYEKNIEAAKRQASMESGRTVI